MTEFKDSQAPLTLEELREVESRFEFRFPQEFHEFYLRHNGGRPLNDRFVYDKGSCVVHMFLPIKYGNRNLTFEHDFRQMESAALLPEYLVPFAVDPGGNYFCFSTRDDEFGAIYIFVNERINDPERASEYLASSLGAFLGSLTKRSAAPS